jgi:DDE superfamily endonuclease
MNLNRVGEQAITTAFKLLGYARRKSVKKGFSDDPVVCRKRLEFAEEAVYWTKERLYRQMFTDEVWAMGGAHTMEYITVKEDGSEKLDPKSVVHKYSKRPVWMFFGTITIRGKGPAHFWEKGEGTINSAKYNLEILSKIQDYFELHAAERLIFMQDNAPSHRSKETTENLCRRHIPTYKHPAYSPDLNLIEHV